jgi:tight adherence protein B
MSEEFFYLLLFMSVILTVLGLYQYYSKDRPTQNKINRRLSLLEERTDRKEVMEILQKERGLGAGWSPNMLQWLEELIVQSGVQLRGARFMVLAGVVSCSITVAVASVLGFHILTLPLSLILSAGVLLFLLRFLRARRLSRFAEQLPDCLDTLVRSLRAGHPLPVALSLVGHEVPDPAGSEFGLASDEVTFGLSVPAAIQNLASRVGAPDLLYFVTSVAIQSQTGGNLGDVLSRLSRLIRDRFRMRRKVHTLSSEGRASAVILSLLPVCLFVAINLLSPAYYGEVWSEPAFQTAMMIAAGLLLTGNFVMWKMVNFKF